MENTIIGHRETAPGASTWPIGRRNFPVGHRNCPIGGSDQPVFGSDIVVPDLDVAILGLDERVPSIDPPEPAICQPNPPARSAALTVGVRSYLRRWYVHLVNEAFELTDHQRQLCLEPDGYFLRACIEHFAFLVTDHGYRMSVHDEGRGCHQVQFLQDIQTEYFAVRIFHDPPDCLWCDVHRFAGLDRQRRLRLSDGCQLFGSSSPPERLDTALPAEQTVPQRVREIADCIRTHLFEFRNLSLA